MNELAQRSQLSFTLKVLNGPEKGAVYRLLNKSVTIGRDKENDIALGHDQKCSRQHAVIEMTSQGIQIKNVSERNVISVNGKEVSAAILPAKSIIKIGNTKLQFNFKNELDRSMANPGIASSKKSKRLSKSSNGPSPMFYIILVGLIGLVYFLMNSDTKKPDSIPTIPSDKEVSAQIEKSRKVADGLRQARRTSGRDTREFREAQAAYIKGFRDSQKGQYERARSHFQTCLAIFPQHKLCGQALIRANSKFDELVEYYFILGSGYLTKNQFRQCKNAFRNVMIMQKDKTSKLYREAEAQFQTCDLKERERL